MRDSGTCKVFNHLSLGAVASLKEGKYLMFPAVGNIRVDVPPGSLVLWGWYSQFEKFGEESWEHCAFLIPLPGKEEQVGSIETAFALIIIDDQKSFLIKSGEALEVGRETVSYDGITLLKVSD